MKIKPKKITNEQIKILEEYGKVYSGAALHKIAKSMPFPVSSIYNLSFTKAKLLIQAIENVTAGDKIFHNDKSTTNI